MYNYIYMYRERCIYIYIYVYICIHFIYIYIWFKNIHDFKPDVTIVSLPPMKVLYPGTGPGGASAASGSPRSRRRPIRAPCRYGALGGSTR